MVWQGACGVAGRGSEGYIYDMWMIYMIHICGEARHFLGGLMPTQNLPPLYTNNERMDAVHNRGSNGLVRSSATFLQESLTSDWSVGVS